MARRFSLEPQLTVEELEGSYRSTKDPVERSRWHFLWLLARGLTAKVIASITGYSAYWIGRIARRYNERDQRARRAMRPGRPLVFDQAIYARRNVVERCINRLKQWRGLATRYEKRAVNYRAMLVIASIVVWLDA